MGSSMHNRLALSLTTVVSSLLLSACVTPEATSHTQESEGEEVLGEAHDALSVWQHIKSLRMGGAGNDTKVQVATDGTGNIVLVGTFSGTMTVGTGATALTSAGGTDVFVIRLTPAGVVRWARRFGGAGNDSASAVAAQDSGEILFTGEMGGGVDFGGGPVAGTAYVTKLNSCGSHVWSKGFGAIPQQPTSWTRPLDVAVNASGTIVLGGAQSGAVDYGAGNILSTGVDNVGPFVQTLGADGSYLWGYGGATDATNWMDATHGVAIDDAGNVAVAGDHRFALWMGGCHTSATSPYSDMFVMKFTSAGACAWATSFGASDGQAFDKGYDVAFGPTGEVLAAGRLDAPGTIGGTALPLGDFLVSLSSAGAVSWARTMGAMTTISGIAADATGNVLVGGTFSGTLNVGGSNLVSGGGTDVFFARYSSASSHLWSASYGNASSQVSTGVAVDPSGNAVFAGCFEGATAFGGSTLTSAGASDLFVAKYGFVVQ